MKSGSIVGRSNHVYNASSVCKGARCKVQVIVKANSGLVLNRLLVLIVGIGIVVVLAVWPYKLVACPKSIFHIRDGNGKPMSGLRIIRRWDTSEGQKGENHGRTDASGSVSFERMECKMSWLKRVTQPLLILIPSSCGGNWEVYGHAEFDIYWPSGSFFNFDGTIWKKVNATYENPMGIHIYDPEKSMNRDYLGLYIFNKRSDFEWTLQIYR